MSKNHKKTGKIAHLDLHSHDLEVLPYDCYISEDCLRQFSNIVERRLKRE